ncbi:MAG TPA: LLM class F420-dependent oxidoreductase [Myxococcota bacterium]|nr:LLM class F420-dependent oxidoreductase [Myxococcota bacterium]
MKIGIPLFQLRHAQIARVAARAEALGFESVWVPEHLVLPVRLDTPYPYSEDGRAPFTPDTPILDPLLLLTHIAAATSRIRLGTNIFVLPLRHPIVAARLAMTLDVLSGGRLYLGIGVGWLEQEFRAVGVDFATRGTRTRECVMALRALWTQAEPEFHGRFFDFGPLKFEPKPVQKPHPPILFGGESDAALRRAAALGDGWYGVAHDPVSARKRVEALRALRAEAGRADAPFEVTVGHGGGPVDAGVLERYADAGVDRVSVLPWSRGRDAIEKLEELAESARSALSANAPS